MHALMFHIGLPPVTLLLVCFALTGHAAKPSPVEVARDVYVFYGARGEISKANGGRVGNAGFIVGANGIVVIDTGGSYLHGRDMIRAIRRISRKPIKLAIITHPFQEFLFGAQAFVERGVPLLAHIETAKLIRGRCEECLSRTKRYVGEAPLRGTKIIVPRRVIGESETWNLGDRTIEIKHFGWGATPGDLVVVDRKSGVAFAGGLLSNARIPDLHDFDFSDGWFRSLDALHALGAQSIVPGHGPALAPHDLHATRNYLTELQAEVKRAYLAGQSLSEAVDSVALAGYRAWDMYPLTHRHNVHRLYLHLEQQELQR